MKQREDLICFRWLSARYSPSSELTRWSDSIVMKVTTSGSRILAGCGCVLAILVQRDTTTTLDAGKPGHLNLLAGSYYFMS